MPKKVVEKKTIYYLDTEVVNPHPDRRTKGYVSAIPAWSKDSLWLHIRRESESVRPGEEGDLIVIETLRCRHLMGDITQWGTPEQWKALQPHLKAFVWNEAFDAYQFAALQLLHNFDYELLIKYLFSRGLLGRDVLVRAQRAIDELEEAADVWKL